MTVRGIDPRSITLLGDVSQGRAPVGPLVATDLVQRALARGAGPVQAAVEATAQVAVKGVPQVASRSGDLRAQLIRMAALVGGTAVVATWAAWKFRPVDAPPIGQKPSEWLNELDEGDRLRQEVAAKYIELFLAELMGLIARAMQLRQELLAMTTQLSSRVYALPLLRQPLQTQATSDPDDSGLDFFGTLRLRLNAEEREALLPEMEAAGWKPTSARKILKTYSSRLGGHKDDCHGDFVLQIFFRLLRDARFSVADQKALLNQVVTHYDRAYETIWLIPQIKRLLAALSSFDAWTPAWQAKLLLTVMKGTQGQVSEALDVVYRVCAPEGLATQSPASWPPVELLETLKRVRKKHGALDGLVTLEMIRENRVQIVVH